MRSSYDDLAGLDMYDAGMGGLIPDMEEAKAQLLAAGSSALAIILATWGMPKVPTPKDWTEANQHRLRAGLAVIGGMLAARGLWNYNRDAAMAVLGGVSGLGLAQLLDSFLEMDILHGTPLGQYDANALSAGDEALLTAYSPDSGTLALTEVGASRPAFQGLGGPVVSNEQLMGAVVATETLGEGYNAYLS